MNKKDTVQGCWFRAAGGHTATTDTLSLVPSYILMLTISRLSLTSSVKTGATTGLSESDDE